MEKVGAYRLERVVGVVACAAVVFLGLQRGVDARQLRLVDSDAAPPLPVLAEQFSCTMKQYDASSNKLLVAESMWWDRAHERARSDFSGPAFPTGMQQIARYDLNRSYALANTTGTPICQAREMVGSLPIFFDIPANATYAGKQTRFGVTADAWSYWDQGQSFTFLTFVDASGAQAPLLVEAAGRWYAHYQNFVAAEPPLSAFALPKGIKCPLVPPEGNAVANAAVQLDFATVHSPGAWANTQVSTGTQSLGERSSAPPLPVLAEQFSCTMKQYDASSNKLLVAQSMWWDGAHERVRSDFSGPEFPTGMQQIARFDLNRSYALSNTTGSPICQSWDEVGSLPVYFDIPANATYAGKQTRFGVTADTWSYWDQGQRFTFLTFVHANGVQAPLLVEAVGRWYSHYQNFVAAEPPLSAFALPKGLKCPLVPPESDVVVNAAQRLDVARAHSPSAWTNTQVSTGTQQLGERHAVPHLPVLAEQFSCTMEQYDAGSNKLLVAQSMWWDRPHERVRSDFSGPAFPTGMQQIARFDLNRSYALANTTGTPICQARDEVGTVPIFFDIPSNATYAGKQTRFGVTADAWSYWDQGQPFTFLTFVDANGAQAPLLVEAVGRWYSHYQNFVAAEPPLSAFALPKGIKCPLVPPDGDAVANAAERLDFATAHSPGAWTNTVWQVSVSAKQVVAPLRADRFVSSTIDVSLLKDNPHCNLTSPRLRTMARALSPMFLRVGGTEADTFYYDMSDTPVASPPAGYKFVLNRSTWDGVNDFASDAGFSIVFGINAGFGPRAPSTSSDGNATGPWIPTNAQMLINYTLQQKYPVVGYEFGNEPDMFQTAFNESVAAQQYVDDTAKFVSIVKGADPSLITVAPDVNFVPIVGDFFWLESSLPFAKQHNVTWDVVSFHFYPTFAPEHYNTKNLPGFLHSLLASDPHVLLQPSVLDMVGEVANEVSSQRDSSLPGADVWLGETGSAVGGGASNVSNAFADGFEYLDKLGQMALGRVGVVFRQTVCGYRYGLLDFDLQPMPSFFTTVLWKQLIGPAVLASTISSGPSHSNATVTLRAYTFCANGPGVVAVLINLHNTSTATVSLDLDGTPAPGQRLDYLLTAKNGTEIGLSEIYLNGQLLSVASDGGVPDMLPSVAPNASAPVSLPPMSYGFFALPNATAAACTSLSR